MIKLKKVSKFYYSKGIIATGFTKVDLEFKLGEFVAITGESGSGKSTLLNVISGLDSYEEGEMYIDGVETSHYTEKDFEDYRRKYISNIFQNFNLVNSYNVYQNVELALLLNGKKKKEVKQEVIDILKKVGLYKFRKTKVSKLSGGQKQRVAIARALAKDTPIIIADEPTGSLDSKSAGEVIKLLSEVAKDKLVIVVTHNYEQVEPYVTRKIKMHDGRVLEDKKIKPIEQVPVKKTASYKNLTFINQLRLGFRNAFNIIPKFILVLAVYLFIISALISEYAAFKQEEDILEKSGYNYVFDNIDEKRIIIKKKDKTSFTEEDYTKIKNLDHVKRIVKNDLSLDVNVSLTDNNNFWLNGLAQEIGHLEGGVDVGRLPSAANEIVIKGSKDDYYISNLTDLMNTTTLYMEDYRGELVKTNPIKIVGIKYTTKEEDASYFYRYTYYVGEELISFLTFDVNEKYSKVKVNFQNLYYSSGIESGEFKIIPTDIVYSGDVYIDYDLSPLCKNNNCLRQPLTIEVENLYYSDSKTLTVTQVYSKKNFKSLFGYQYDENNKGAIYINTNDYKSLFNKEPFQSSAFVDDSVFADEVADKLEKAGYTTLVIKNTLVKDPSYKILQIFKTIVTIVLIVALFFISYFVIQLILKSRNIYYSILRMLGANTKIAKRLLLIELLVVANLAYWLVIGAIFLQHLNVYNLSYIQVIIDYLKLSDYILVFIIINCMTYFISMKFSRKLFKRSVMTTMKEEV